MTHTDDLMRLKNARIVALEEKVLYLKEQIELLSAKLEV